MAQLHDNNFSNAHAELKNEINGGNGNVSETFPSPYESDDANLLPQKVSESESSSGSFHQGKMTGNWGWFEDVHAQESSVASNPSDDTVASNERKEKTSGKNAGNVGMFQSFPTPLEEVITPEDGNDESRKSAVTPPTYVLEESRSSQNLWKKTAGNRPPQPVEERQFFEQLWAINFSQSKVNYGMPTDVLQRASPFVLSPFADGTYDSTAGAGEEDYDITKNFDDHASNGNLPSVKETEADVVDEELRRTKDSNAKFLQRSFGPHYHRHTLVNKKIGHGANVTVLVKGDNVFGTTVSKNFTKIGQRGRPENVSVSISIGSYRVIEQATEGKYAQYLVIYCEGDFRETVGVWKRHSDFEDLSRLVAAGQEGCASKCSPFEIPDEYDYEVLPNAMTSWRLLQKRQRWYRCLDAGYLSLKSFLLERFLHDILFECRSPKMLRDFIGVHVTSQ